MPHDNRHIANHASRVGLAHRTASLVRAARLHDSGRRNEWNRGGAMAHRTERLSTRIEIAFARGVMIVMAIGIAFTGAMLLTTPVAIPFTISLWLGAAAIMGLGVWGKLPHDS
jgi:hypothetical protein